MLLARFEIGRCFGSGHTAMDVFHLLWGCGLVMPSGPAHMLNVRANFEVYPNCRSRDIATNIFHSLASAPSLPNEYFVFVFLFRTSLMKCRQYGMLIVFGRQRRHVFRMVSPMQCTALRNYGAAQITYVTFTQMTLKCVLLRVRCQLIISFIVMQTSSISVAL